MLNIIFGIIIGLIFIFINFGFEIKTKSKPRIKINIPYFIQDSRIIVYNKHIHHWLISLILFLIIVHINNNNSLCYILEGFFISLIVHGLLYKDAFDFDV